MPSTSPASDGKKKFDDGGVVNVEPSDPQKDAGNYRKGHARINGMLVSIESPQGATRSGTDPDGAEWSQEMSNHYGYIRGTQGRDKDHLDVFLGPKVGSASTPVHVIDQLKPDASFDEHKVMLGFPDQQSAVEAYHANYPDDWKGFGAISSMPLDTFKQWAFAPGRRVKPAADHSLTGTAGYANGGSVPGYADGGSTNTIDPSIIAMLQAANLQPGSVPLAANTGYVGLDGQMYQANVTYDDNGQPVINGYSVYDPSKTGAGNAYAAYDPSGAYTGQKSFQNGAPISDFLTFLGAAFGINALGGAIAGGASGAGTGMVGDSTAAGYGGLNAADAASMGGGATINGGAALGLTDGTGVLGLGSNAGYDPFYGTGSTTMANGEFLGENVPSGVDSWDKAFTNAGGTFDPLYTVNPVNPASSADYRNGSDVMSDNFDSNGGYGAGGFGGGSGAYVAPGLSGGSAGGGAGIPGSLSDWTKLLGTLTTLLGGTKTPSGTPAPAPAAPFDYGPAKYLPPGWRTDRPMYVPGQDAIPQGWLGAGGTTA